MPARELSSDAPDGVRRHFDEAQRCMSVRAYTGAAVLARKVLEGIAIDLGATAYQLGKKLTELENARAIDGRLVDWARALQIVGNDAAHNMNDVVSREDATDALSFAEALADYVYTFHARYNRFEARRRIGEPNDEESFGDVNDYEQNPGYGTDFQPDDESLAGQSD